MENKKVKNAKKTLFDGILFDSTLEARFAMLLKSENIEYQYNNLSIEIQDKFEYNGEKIRAMHYTPDFIIGNYLVEVKGYPTDAWRIRRKVILTYMHNHPEWKWREVKNISQMRDFIKQIK